jgi:membrane protein YqaA with SNARE-associated domain
MFEIDFFTTYGLIALFVICFLSATILPLSSEFVFIWFLYSSEFSNAEILVTASLGNILGGLTNYFIGFYSSKLIKIKEENKAYRIALTYGHFAAFFSWIPFIGDPILLVLGFLKSSFWKMMIFMSLGKILRYAFLLLFNF